MAIKNFILQGFTPRTHADAINRLLEVPEIQRVILSVAYINEEGVLLLEDKLRTVANKTKVFSGIRNEITSLQGLTKLIDIGVSLYVIDMGARKRIFHPKLYLARGRNLARLVIGSANLTLAGLNNNVEAGLILDLHLKDPKDKELVDDIEKKLLGLISRDPKHIWLIKSEKELERLQRNGKLLDETEVLPPRPLFTKSSPLEDKISPIKLDVSFRFRTIHQAKAKVVKRRMEKNEIGIPDPTQVATNIELLWESKPLEERDLNIPSTKNTHPTGAMNFDKGLLEDQIDHRHYFRNIVFKNLNWKVQSLGTAEEAEALFQLNIKGIYHGEFPLWIRHKTDTSSATYRQHNAMTSLRWGYMRDYIARRDLIDRTLSLYRDKTDSKRFVLEID